MNFHGVGVPGNEISWGRGPGRGGEMKLDDPIVDPMLMEGDMLGKWAGKLRDRKRASRLQCAWSRALPPGSSPLDPRLVPVCHPNKKKHKTNGPVLTYVRCSHSHNVGKKSPVTPTDTYIVINIGIAISISIYIYIYIYIYIAASIYVYLYPDLDLYL